MHPKPRDRFPERKKLLAVREDALRVAQRLRERLLPGRKAELRAVIEEQHPADLADAMYFLNNEEDREVFEALTVQEAAEVLDEVDDTTLAALAQSTPPQRLADILDELRSDAGAYVVETLSEGAASDVLSRTAPEIASDIRRLLAYPAESAGRVMSTDYVDVPVGGTQAEALDRFRSLEDAEHIFYVFATDAKGVLRGMVDLKRLLTAPAHTPLVEIMDEDVITVEPHTDQERVAHVFARYDLTALPVVEAGTSRLLGVVTAEDVIEILQEERAEDVAHLTGTDADELEKKTPAEVAKLRLPWILATMFIELGAGFVIAHFDGTLRRIILLASFMPIISAISGNTGLQSAAIIIRGLSTGHVELSNWRHAVIRQLGTTVIIGAACGIVLGVIGSVWDRSWGFGVVVAGGMFASINIAGAVGTVIPLISKRLGFDPALTAGPFETAFQDVVGISIFLSFATAMLPFLH